MVADVLKSEKLRENLNWKRMFVRTDNVFELLARHIVDFVRAFQLLDTHDDWSFDYSAPLRFTEVFKELSDLPASSELLLQIFKRRHLYLCLQTFDF